MPKILRALLLIALPLLGFALVARAADMTWTFAVQLAASVNADPARVELHWTTDPFPVRSYTVQRKAVGAADWEEGVALPADATSFTDDKVELGHTYEYQVIRRAVAYTAYGYIAVGINAPLVDNRGKVVLVIDASIADPLAKELQRLAADLAGDGWTVARHDVPRDATPESVKATIKAEWDADRDRTKAVLLLGHVPVVRSGNLNVDGHQARPMPADVFYGEMDGAWTDANGDGIYDQNTLPSDVELMVGRVDFADLPGTYSPVAYPNEIELLRRYLDKDNAYRQATLRLARRALVGNQIGDASGQAYAASGYRSFAPLIGAENITTTDPTATAAEQKWTGMLAARDYLFVYGCGAGSDFTAGGLGTHGQYSDLWASDFLELKLRGAFYLMFGSWFSEWNKPDNLLRTALAAPDYGLGAVWSGRPHIFLHLMGIGEPIGAGIRLSQNNSGLYQNQVQRQLRGIHVALLGDPTLRLPPIAPPTGARVVDDNGSAVVTWKASADNVLGYHIYRASGANGPFARVTEAPVNDTRFVDTGRGDATFYLVRAIALRSGPSGSYYDASQGAWAHVGD